MPRRPTSGSVLVHVLVTSVIASAIAAGMLQVLMARYTLAARATKGAQKQKEAQATLNRVLSHWNANGFCTSPGGNPAITCTGATTVCSACSCTVAGGGSLTAGDTYPNCSLTILSSE